VTADTIVISGTSPLMAFPVHSLPPSKCQTWQSKLANIIRQWTVSQEQLTLCCQILSIVY